MRKHLINFLETSLKDTSARKDLSVVFYNIMNKHRSDWPINQLNQRQTYCTRQLDCSSQYSPSATR